MLVDQNKYSGIDIFAGAGGLTEGFIQAGYNIIATIDKDYWASETIKTRLTYHWLKSNGLIKYYWDYCKAVKIHSDTSNSRKKLIKKYPELGLILKNSVVNAELGNLNKGDQYVSSDSVIKKVEKAAKFYNVNIDFVIGGPPCQAYSYIGRSRLKEKANRDDRNYLFKYYLEIVDYFKPKFFLFENVPGMITAKNGGIFEMIGKDFASIRYKLLFDEEGLISVHNALDFGVPQNRKRYIILGIKDGEKIEYPVFKHKSNNGLLTTYDAISDLPPLKPGEGGDHYFSEYPNGPDSTYQRKIRNGSIGILNHKARSLNKWYDKKIYQIAIDQKKKGLQLQYHSLPVELKKHSNDNNFQDRFKVHDWNIVPHTIVAHIAKDGHYNIHPDKSQLRSLTVREAARIQSFPDNYKFEGPRTSQYKQVGNAVPPIMAKEYGKAIKKQLD